MNTANCKHQLAERKKIDYSKTLCLGFHKLLPAIEFMETISRDASFVGVRDKNIKMYKNLLIWKQWACFMGPDTTGWQTAKLLMIENSMDFTSCNLIIGNITMNL
jgi:hypothetical protein